MDGMQRRSRLPFPSSMDDLRVRVLCRSLSVGVGPGMATWRPMDMARSHLWSVAALS